MLHESNPARLRAYVEPHEDRLVLFLTGTVPAYRHLLGYIDRLAATETPDPISLRSGIDPLDDVGNTNLRFTCAELPVPIDISGDLAKQEVTFTCTKVGLTMFREAITGLIEHTSPDYHVHLDAHPAAPPSKLHAILFKKAAAWFDGIDMDELLMEEPLNEA